MPAAISTDAESLLAGSGYLWGESRWSNGSVLISAPEELAGELAGMLRRGVTSDGLAHCPGLLGLALVRAKSASDAPADLAAGCTDLLAEVAARVDGTQNGPSAVLLGVARGWRRTLLKARRAEAAQLLHVEINHFRKEREDPLIEAMADELYAQDAAYRLRHRQRSEEEIAAQSAAMGIDWLAQHRSYLRIWTPVTGMRADLLRLMEYLEADDEDHDVIADRLCSLTWFYARFLREMARFVEEQGGLWLLSDPEAEAEVAEAVYQLTALTPFGEADDSWLRLLLAKAEQQELEPFADLLIAAGERRRELMGAWVRWARREDDSVLRDGPPAAVDRWVAVGERFVRLVEDDRLRLMTYLHLSAST